MKRKLNYRFHNPNTEEEMADFILKVFIDVNKGKVELALREAASKIRNEENDKCMHSA